jgi:anti-sigma-K factor RskA
MSDRDRTADRRECGGDVAAYTLGALDAAEAGTFRRHLETCTICQEELASLQKVVNELPLTVAPHKAPVALRRRVMREVKADARARRRAGSAEPRPRRSGRAGWLVPRPALALGVALLVAVGVTVGVISGTSGGPSPRVIIGQVVGAGTAQLRIVPGRASVVVHHLAPPPAGKIYEVWVVRGQRAPAPTSALFSPTSAGNADVEVPGTIKDVSAVLVTPEPMGGSPHPTHAPVISFAVG